MTSDAPRVLTNTALRLLSDREMEFGLNLMDQTLMCYRMSMLRLEQETEHLAQQVQALARQAASRRLAEGKEVYVQVEGIDGIVCQNADGRRELVEIVNGQPVFLRSL